MILLASRTGPRALVGEDLTAAGPTSRPHWPEPHMLDLDPLKMQRLKLWFPLHISKQGPPLKQPQKEASEGYSHSFPTRVWFGAWFGGEAMASIYP